MEIKEFLNEQIKDLEELEKTFNDESMDKIVSMREKILNFILLQEKQIENKQQKYNYKKPKALGVKRKTSRIYNFGTSSRENRWSETWKNF